MDSCKDLRISVYRIDECYKDKMPAKVISRHYEDQIAYARKLVALIHSDEPIASHPAVKEALNYVEEVIVDNQEHLAQSKDQDARVGHKTADTSFFGYKTHLVLTPERIITAYAVTSGEKPDGKELDGLIALTEKTGIKVDTVVGDTAYSEKDNLRMAKERNIKLVAKLSEMITHSPNMNSSNFVFNKDAGMYVCKEGHMSVKKPSRERKKGKRTARLLFCRTTSMWRSANCLRIGTDATRKVPRRSLIPSR